MPSDLFVSLNFKGQNTVTGLREPRLDNDAVRLLDLQYAISAIQGQMQNLDFGNNKLKIDLTNGVVQGDDTIFSISHNFNTLDVIAKVYDKISGEDINVEFIRIINSPDNCQVIFRGNNTIPSNRYRLLLLRIA